MNNVALAIVVISIFFLGVVSTFWIILSSYRITELLESYLEKSKFVASNRKVLFPCRFGGAAHQKLCNGTDVSDSSNL